MSEPFRSFRQESKTDWGTTAVHPDEYPGTERITLGAALRIADAVEKMASSYDSMRDERNRLQRWWNDELAKNKKLRRSNAALRGVISRKNKQPKL